MKAKFLLLGMGLLIALSSCRLFDVPKPYRKSIFDEYLKADFNTEYYIYPGQFTQPEIETIKQGFKNWEPIMQKLSGTDITFKFMGVKEVPIDHTDDIHVVVRMDHPAHIAACTKLAYRYTSSGKETLPIMGADIHINSDYTGHTTDQWHLEGWREYFSECMESVVAHEVGHLLGLDHSKLSTDLMFEKNYADCRREPSAGDIRNLEVHYLNILQRYFSFENK